MTTAKLTKTQRAMLEKAARRPSGVASASHGYRSGCRGSYGGRDSKTLCQLRDMGLVGAIQTSSGRHYYGHGECDHYTEAWATITEEGRAALAVE